MPSVNKENRKKKKPYCRILAEIFPVVPGNKLFHVASTFLFFFIVICEYKLKPKNIPKKRTETKII
jgi:hypothetical protein